MILIKGTITEVLYRNDDFLIAMMQSNEQRMKIKGNIYGVEKGETVEVWGVWETHSTYGRQFDVESWQRPIPQTEEQILAFLSSPIIKGCGKKQAGEIVQTFGKQTLDVIAKEREFCLLKIKGIGKKRAKKIVDSVMDTFGVQKVVSELLTYGITANMALRAYKEYGSNTIETIKRNPYKLIELNLVGFLKADEIAKRMGIMPISSYRIEACLQYVLQKQCFESGHTYISQQELLEETKKALNHNVTSSEMVTMNELEDSLMCTEEKMIVNEGGCIFPKFLHNHEQQLGRKLSKMRRFRNGQGMPTVKKCIDWYQRRKKMILGEKQREAIQQLFDEQLLILTGGPGTGKTTVVRAMIDIYKEMYPKHIIRLAAPTSRASRKLSQVAGQDASTIHRLIGYRQGEWPEYHPDNPLPCNLLIVDEMSMVDVKVASHLIQALNDQTKVLFVGDIDQLPSVSPGNVLRDMIQAGLPTIELTEVFRQAQESQIIKNAHRVNQGKSIVFDKEKDDFYFLVQQYPKKIAALLVRSASRFQELGYDLSDILVLSPMKKGPVGTEILNEMLREKLNPSDVMKQEWKIGKSLFRLGDKVIQVKNNYEKQIFNGDTGVITGFRQKTDDDGNVIDIMEIDYFGKEITYTKTETKELNLGYAITIHKAQGGEAPIVLIPATISHYMMLERNLLYTAMTRATEKLVFIGTKKALNTAIANNQIIKRNSKLAERINKYTNSYKPSQREADIRECGNV
ncbi:SF1B family DNA helicase RecD2 [Lentibacillus cibarius]|uniref:ATP-dependent RecD2 DNA helicase n=1 Tax=Lentibacillus cibarius TaxID=2583219 RepID=A0A5S3QGD4_9BACI|nr:ATP-dependent RecD-like DNA helicase [Lentibacillus cibarius]TMN20950.1 ATP-dependent RecD-like DNA helicase [Lentibacillus cibarius]